MKKVNLIKNAILVVTSVGLGYLYAKKEGKIKEYINEKASKMNDILDNKEEIENIQEEEKEYFFVNLNDEEKEK